MKKTVTMIILTLLCVILIDNYQQKNRLEKLEEQRRQEESSISAEKPQEEPEEENYVTFLALGQTLLDDSTLQSGVMEDGSRNYDFIFSGVDSYIENSDITALCHGSVIGGNGLGVSGYPAFNAPEEFAAAAVNHGIHAVAMANVRINRLGSEAIVTSKKIWENLSPDIHVLGIHDNPEDTGVCIVESHGIKIALLNYTAIVEDALSDEDASKVDFFGNYAGGSADLTALSEKTLAQIDLANKSADFVVVFASWGIENTHEITNAQTRFANLLAEAGVDLIIGNRTNYMQKVEWVTAENGNRALCFYSLGNFVSTESDADALTGGMARVGIKVENGLTVIDEENISLIPVVTYYTGDTTENLVRVAGVLPFENYTDEMAQSHGLLTKYGIDFSRQVIQNIIDTNVDAAFR